MLPPAKGETARAADEIESLILGIAGAAAGAGLPVAAAAAGGCGVAVFLSLAAGVDVDWLAGGVCAREPAAAAPAATDGSRLLSFRLNRGSSSPPPALPGLSAWDEVGVAAAGVIRSLFRSGPPASAASASVVAAERSSSSTRSSSLTIAPVRLRFFLSLDASATDEASDMPSSSSAPASIRPPPPDSAVPWPVGVDGLEPVGEGTGVKGEPPAAADGGKFGVVAAATQTSEAGEMEGSEPVC